LYWIIEIHVVPRPAIVLFLSEEISTNICAFRGKSKDRNYSNISVKIIFTAAVCYSLTGFSEENIG